jgi:hypothetical protein|tara:strand:- start:10444 stop:10728 length:285 start_codon:yes stop_codon:yes gene_type:complete
MNTREIKISASSCNNCKIVVGTNMGGICGATGKNVSSDIIKKRFNEECPMKTKVAGRELLKDFMYWYSEEAHPHDIDSIISKYLSERKESENEN